MNSNSCNPTKKTGSGYLTIIVLYILLAIILASVVY
jgi:hypothetical protein